MYQTKNIDDNKIKAPFRLKPLLPIAKILFHFFREERRKFCPCGRGGSAQSRSIYQTQTLDAPIPSYFVLGRPQLDYYYVQCLVAYTGENNENVRKTMATSHRQSVESPSNGQITKPISNQEQQITAELPLVLSDLDFNEATFFAVYCFIRNFVG